MSSTAQIEANRANAQRSTGPRTPQGKLASSANATREGLTSSQIIVHPGEEDRFNAMRTALLTELDPTGECQRHCFEIILHAAWNIERCIALEGQLQLQAIESGSIDAILDDQLAAKLDRIYRYKKMHENSHRKAVAELRKLQAEEVYRSFQHPNAVDSRVLLDSIKLDVALNAVPKKRVFEARPFESPATQESEDDRDDLQNEPVSASSSTPNGPGIQNLMRHLKTRTAAA